MTKDYHRSTFLIFVLNIYLFIYLASPGLNCGTQDLRCGVWDLRCGTWDL